MTITAFPGHAGAIAFPGHAGAIAFPGHAGAIAFPGHAGRVRPLPRWRSVACSPCATRRSLARIIEMVDQ